MARHVVHRRNGQIDEYQELPDAEHLEPDPDDDRSAHKPRPPEPTTARAGSPPRRRCRMVSNMRSRARYPRQRTDSQLLADPETIWLLELIAAGRIDRGWDGGGTGITDPYVLRMQEAQEAIETRMMYRLAFLERRRRAGVQLDLVCGRYVSVQSRADLLKLYNATAVGPELTPSYNVAPTNQVYVTIDHTDPTSGDVQRQVRGMKWGLVPSWSRDPKIGSRLINARVESLASKPSWRTPFRKRRAVLGAAGYYEWTPRESDGKVRKQPYYIHPSTGLLSFAGLYELWPDPDKAADDPDRWLWTTTIITADAAGPQGDVHDRTPLILSPDRIDAWLDPSRTDPDEVKQILDGIVLKPLDIRPVSTAVNKVGTNGPQLIEPLDQRTDQSLQLTLTGRTA